MQSSKYTLTFTALAKWVLAILGTYLFWLIAYFILAKFALAEIRDLQSSALTISNASVFWYLIYLGALLVCVFIVYRLISYAPNPRIAGIIYTVLLSSSTALIVASLAPSTDKIRITPHIFINACFLIAGLMTFFNLRPAKDPGTNQELN